MGVVTGGAGQLIAGFLLAGAFEQRFPLARGPASRSVCAAIDKEQGVIEEVISRDEGLQLPACALDDDLSLEMATEADRVATDRLHCVNVGHGDSAAGSDVCAPVAMACCAGDSPVGEWRAGVVIAGVGKGRCDCGGMTVEAAWINGEGEGHFACGEIVGRHIPDLFLFVPVDGGFKPVALLLEKVGSPTFAGTEEVDELLAATERVFD